MKRLLTTTLIAFLICSFTVQQEGVIKGRVTPAEGAYHAWAISNKDTLETAISLGSFQFSGIKPGTYKVVINAHAPYQDLVRDDVLVTDEAVVDLGDIQLVR